MQKFKKAHLLSGACILCFALLATGCKPPQRTTISDYESATYSVSSGYSGSSASGTSSTDGMQIQKEWEERTRELVLDVAALAKGTPYVYGGTSLSGFDCSGFVRWAYDSVGVDLPRSAREQSQFGKSIDRASLRVGDIVAFRHPKRGYHTGLYVGNGQFIHSPRRRDVVKISSLTDPYFNTSYLGARRPALPESVDLAQVQKKMMAIKAQKKAIETASLSRKRTADSKKSAVTAKKKSTSSKSKKTSQASSKKIAQSKDKKAQQATSTKKSSKGKVSTTKASAKKTSAKKASTTNKKKPQQAATAKNSASKNKKAQQTAAKTPSTKKSNKK